MPNPYAPGEVPRILAGRDRELTVLRDRLGRVETYGEYGGPLVVFHAPRGVGKTSLLREAEQGSAVPAGFVTVWVSCPAGQPMLPSLLHGVARALEAADAVPPGSWRPALSRVGVEVGVPGVKISADWTDAADAEQASPAGAAEVGVHVVEQVLHTAAIQIRTHGGAGLAVFIDELHAAPQRDLAVLLNALQNLNGARAENPIVVAAAGLPSTPGHLLRAATFGERSTFAELEPLTPQEAAYAVTAPAGQLDVEWEPEAVAALVERARGYPYFVQLIASATWDQVRPDAGQVITISDLTRGQQDADRQMQSLYEARWDAATPLERELLAAMAELAGEDEAVSRAEAARLMGRASGTLSVPRDRLIEKGIIESPGRGTVRYTLPGFAVFVRDARRA